MIAALLVIAAAAGGQAPAVAAAAEPERSECIKPALLDNRAISAAQLAQLVERAQDYIACRSKEIEAQRQVADETLTVARAAAERSNAMIVDLNAFVAAVKEYLDERSGG